MMRRCQGSRCGRHQTVARSSSSSIKYCLSLLLLLPIATIYVSVIVPAVVLLVWTTTTPVEAWIPKAAPRQTTKIGFAASGSATCDTRIRISSSSSHCQLLPQRHSTQEFRQGRAQLPWRLDATQGDTNDSDKESPTNKRKGGNNNSNNNGNSNKAQKPTSAQGKQPQTPRKSTSKKSTDNRTNNLNKETVMSKQDLVKAVGNEMKKAKNRNQKGPGGQRPSTTSSSASSTSSSDADATMDDATAASSSSSSESVLDRINPFKAGQKLRQTIDTAITSIQTTTTPDAVRQSKYYLDDRFLELSSVSTSDAKKSSFRDWKGFDEEVGSVSNSNSIDDDFVPEVLVVGATGAIGQLVVRQLQTKRVRIRVLVKDLYTSTLNLFGTGVTYCPGDLSNADSLEYACTDVDKLVFCAVTPRPDEDQFQTKFQEFVSENSATSASTSGTSGTSAAVRQTMANAQKEQREADVNARSNAEWQQLDSILAVRAALAEQVDVIGMQNLVRAYQHVRHSDYGTSQAAKRSLFKFQDRPEDFTLFDIDNDDDDDDVKDSDGTEAAAAPEAAAKVKDGLSKGGAAIKASNQYDYYDDEEEEYTESSTYSEYDDYADTYGNTTPDDEYDDYDMDSVPIEQRSDANAVQTQSRWIRNQFEHGVFVGRIPRTSVGSSGSGVAGQAAEAAIVSSRLRARDDPENGIELGPSFAGFVVRLCSDGSVYEAFVRTGAYATHGVEYVCEFSTRTKMSALSKANKSTNKFTTLRLPFENFKPVQRKQRAAASDGSSTIDAIIPPFRGKDVRHIGFRYRSDSNAMQTKVDTKSGAAWNRFYLALSYIKVYRSQPEPEFVYLSDARIPPVVRNNMIRHEARQLVGTSAATTSGLSSSSGSDTMGSYEGIRLLDDSVLDGTSSSGGGAAAGTANRLNRGRSPEETYFKYRGEEILKNSGLSYAIVRVSDFNESPSSSEETIDLSSDGWSDGNRNAVNGNGDRKHANDEMEAVSRADVAKVCVSALLDPQALNKSFYVSKKKVTSLTDLDQDMSSKFAALPMDQIA